MGILKVSVAAAVVAGIGLGLALGWGLNELARGSLGGRLGPRPREEEEEPRIKSGAGPSEAAPAVESAPPVATAQPTVGAFDPCGPDSQACPPGLLREGWARRRQERVKAIVGEESYRTMEALIRWCWGAPVEEVRAGLPLGRSGFYWRMEQVLTRLPHLLEDGRCHNGRRRPQAEEPTPAEAGEIEDRIAGRTVEVVVGQPNLSPAQISRRLQEQDGTLVDAQKIADYLAQARLAHYVGSPYRQRRPCRPSRETMVAPAGMRRNC